MLSSVQYMRAVAALMVVIFHVLTNMYGSDKAGADPHIYIFSGGVDLFFVISGFVMFHATAGRQVGIGNFLSARLTRIVPLYWLANLCLLAIVAVIGNPLPSLSDVTCSLLFVPCHMASGSVYPIFNPGWTLNYEMFFYATFACALFIRDWRLRFAAVTVFFLGVVALKPVLAPLGAAGTVYANGIILEFVMGMAVAAAYRVFGQKIPKPRMFIALGLLLGIGLMESHGFKVPRMVYAALPAALILIGLLALEGKIWKLPLLGLLGDASYSIYLSHPIVLDLVDYWVPFTGQPSLVSGTVAVLASAGMGVAVYHYVEKPIIHWFKGRRQVAIPDVAAAAAAR